MTDQELKNLVASLAVSQAKTDEAIKNLGLNVDGINKTTGLEAEEFFYSSLNKNKVLNDIKFDSIMSNILVDKADRTHEMDIFFENGNSVGIVEVKYYNGLNKLNNKNRYFISKVSQIG